MIDDRRGITLLEALVSVSLVTIISLVLMGLFIGHVRISRLVSANADLLNQRTQLEQDFDRFIHLATRVVDSAIVNGTSYTSGLDTLVLEIPSIDGSGFVIADQFDQLAYYLDPADPSSLKVTFQPGGASSRLNVTKSLGNSVDSVQYFYDSPSPVNASLINVKVNLQQPIFGKKRIIYLNTLMHLRNK